MGGRFAPFFADYINERVDEAYQEAVENGVNLKKINSYKNGIKKQLIADGIESDYKLLVYLEEQKDKLRHLVSDNQLYMLIHEDSHPNNYFFFNNDGLIQTVTEYKLLTNTVDETLEFLQINKDVLNFKCVKCTSPDKNRLGLL